jgi:hypothetical protein
MRQGGGKANLQNPSKPPHLLIKYDMEALCQIPRFFRLGCFSMPRSPQNRAAGALLLCGSLSIVERKLNSSPITTDKDDRDKDTPLMSESLLALPFAINPYLLIII